MTGGGGDHIVELSRLDAETFRLWLAAPNGSLAIGRVTFEAVQGGGVLVRTRPYAAVTPSRYHRASTEADLYRIVGAPGDRGFTVDDQQWWILVDGGWKRV